METNIQQDFSAIMADFAAKTLGNNNETSTTVAATMVTEPTPTEVQPTQPAVSTAPEVKAEVPEVKVEDKPEVPAVEGPFADWDSAPATPEFPTAPTTLPAEVYLELGKVLGIDKIQGKEDVVKAITALKLEAEKAKGPDKTQIRPELAKAIELDQKGGDFYEYLKVTSVDYSKADPVQLYEDYVIDSLADQNGNVDEDQVNDLLDNMKDSEKKLKGLELQRRLVQDQQRRVVEIETEAIRKKEQNDAQLKAALGGLNEVDGFKVDDRHRREVFEWVTGKMMRDLFYGPDGNLDPAKVARIGFRNLYYEKLDSYQKSKIRNATKREVLSDLTNSNITTPAIPVAPSVNKPFGLDDLIKSYEQNMINR